MRCLLLLVPVVALAAVTGCGSGSDADEASAASRPAPAASPAPQRTAQKKPAARRGKRIKLAGSQFGKMLYDGHGQAIYLFDKERTRRAECYGACAEAWPPVITKGKPRALRGVRKRLLGTTRRRDGKLQVTYAGHPLYFYAHEKRNQVLCHDVREFGGLWLVVGADGRALD